MTDVTGCHGQAGLHGCRECGAMPYGRHRNDCPRNTSFAAVTRRQMSERQIDDKQSEALKRDFLKAIRETAK